jgi:hypothetical protein
MKILLTAITVASIAMSSAFAEGKMYLQTPSGFLSGPYRFKLGEEIPGGTIVIPSKRRLELQKRLKKTIIPQIDFRQANVRDAFAFIQTASRKYSPETLPPGEVQIELDLTGYIREIHDPFAPQPEQLEPPPSVTISARYLSVQDAIILIADIISLNYQLDEDKVVLTPKYKLYGQPD